MARERRARTLFAAREKATESGPRSATEPRSPADGASHRTRAKPSTAAGTTTTVPASPPNTHAGWPVSAKLVPLRVRLVPPAGWA